MAIRARNIKKAARLCVLMGALAGCTPVVPTAAPPAETAPSAATAAPGGPVVMRRLTAQQYRQIIEDAFGASIALGGRFEPDRREAGLVAVGAGRASITASGFEQYDKMARAIAAQVVDARHRAQLISCRPADAAKPDDACATKFLAAAGRLLYRRPLTQAELQAHVNGAGAAATRLGDFYRGLGIALGGLLASPDFLFIHEFTEADPRRSAGQRLDAYSKASRLSFFLWNTMPDDELLAAAARGELHNDKGLARQVDRLLASPRLESGVRAFFTDMLGFDTFATLAKDATLYPKFTFKVAEAAQEQTLRTLVDHLLMDKGDYRDIFTTRKTFLTPLLASVYRVRMASPNGLTDTWSPYRFADDEPQAGILTQASFVALHSHPGRSSPTLRGKALRETLLCQKVPDPPANVNFNIVQDTANPNFKTVRQRLLAHSTEAMCAGCHKITDPMGLALENFDAIGGYRRLENGAVIDSTGELDGVRFGDAVGLGKAMHDNTAAPACLIKRAYTYAVGREATPAESTWLNADVTRQFAADGYRLPLLLRRIAVNETFYRVAGPSADASAQRASAAPNDRQPEAGQ